MEGYLLVAQKNRSGEPASRVRSAGLITNTVTVHELHGVAPTAAIELINLESALSEPSLRCLEGTKIPTVS